MSLYQRSDGKWCVDYRDEFNRRHRKPVGSREAALLVESQILDARAEQRRAVRSFQQGEQLALADAREAYLAEVKATDETKAHMRDRLRLFEQHCGQSQLAQVTPLLLKTWMARRAQALSPQTLWRDVKMLRAWFRWLESKNFIFSNPAATLQFPKPTETRARAITYAEEAALLAVLEPGTALRCLLSLDAGLSLGEITALRKNHLDFATHLVNVLVTTKRHAPRSVPMTARLEARLKAAVGHCAPDTFVDSRAGRPVKPHSANKFMPDARRRMGANFRFHDLRHTFATRLAAGGASVFVVSALTGHHLYRWATNREGTPILTELRQYVHPSTEELRAAVAAMEAANPNQEQSA